MSRRAERSGSMILASYQVSRLETRIRGRSDEERLDPEFQSCLENRAVQRPAGAWIETGFCNCNRVGDHHRLLGTGLWLSRGVGNGSGRDNGHPSNRAMDSEVNS